MQIGNGRPALTLVEIDASVSNPIGLVSPDVVPLSKALRRVFLKIMVSGDPLALPNSMDIHSRRALALLYRAGILTASGMTSDGFAALLLDTIPVLTESAAPSPGRGARWLDLALLYRPAVPVAAPTLKTEEYRRLLGWLLAKDAGETDPAMYAAWLAAARRHRQRSPIIPYNRSRAVYHLWPGGPAPLEMAVLVVDGR
jgi:hypothetical protein